jgi:hypothetical protein
MLDSAGLSWYSEIESESFIIVGYVGVLAEKEVIPEVREILVCKREGRIVSIPRRPSFY